MKTIKLLAIDLVPNEIKNISGGRVMAHELKYTTITKKHNDIIDNTDSLQDDWFDIMCIGSFY